jgi:hypothetical protein
MAVCPHCLCPWNAGINRHILLYCTTFTAIRASRLPAIIESYSSCLTLISSDRNLSTTPLNDGELLMVLMGRRPAGLRDEPDSSSALMPGPPPTAADIALHTKALGLHQQAIIRIAWMLAAMIKTRSNIMRRLGR